MTMDLATTIAERVRDGIIAAAKVALAEDLAEAGHYGETDIAWACYLAVCSKAMADFKTRPRAIMLAGGTLRTALDAAYADYQRGETCCAPNEKKALWNTYMAASDRAHASFQAREE